MAKTKAKKIVKTVFNVGIIVVYVAMIVVLVTQALTPGAQSANISNSVGDKLDEIVTEIQKPQVQTVAVESVEFTGLSVFGQNLTGENITIPVTSVGKIKSKVLPKDASNPSLLYYSSNESVIKVSADGKIEALALGQATVSVCSQEKNTLNYSVNITVIDIPIQGFSVKNVPTQIRVDQSYKLDIVYQPANTSQRTLTYTSSNKEVLSVSSSGTIKGKKEGSATVTVTSTVNPEYSVNMLIEVLPQKEEPVIPVTGVEILSGGTSGYIGDTIQLTAKVLPSGASESSFIWTVSDESIATIDQNGLVTLLKAGSVTVNVKCGHYDVENSMVLTVKNVISKYLLLHTENLTKIGEDCFSLKQGQAGKLVAELDEKATVFDVVYTSSNPEIAKISQDGVIEALKGGTVTITATTSNGVDSTSTSFTLTINKLTFKDNVQNFYYIVRKGFGHFAAFLVLGIFGSLTYFILFSKTTKGKILAFFVNLIAGFAVAGITEILQLPIFTPGRTCSFNDVMLDFRGYCCSAIAIYLVVFAVHFIILYKNKKKIKKEERPTADNE